MDAFARNVNDLIRAVFNRKSINKLARKSGFVQRKSALDGYDFLVAMTLGSLSTVNKSLCSLVNSISGTVTRSALHQRMDESAVLFMKMALEYTLEKICRSRSSISPGVFRRFNRILAWDSSKWGVHESLQKVFKGTSGSASGAAVSLQYAYDVKSSILEFFDIASGTTNDQSYRGQIEKTIKPRDLLLIDRGYFVINLFKAIGESAAFYITRFKIGTTLYLANKDDYKKLDIYRLLRHCKDRSILEFEICLGRDKLPCRVVCVRIPEKTANRKRRELRKEAKSRGKQVSKERLVFAGWCVIITNVPSTKLNAREVAEMYRLRWSIELVFKQLKSTFGMDKITHKNESRLLCEIYAILIIAALTQRIHGMAQQFTWSKWKQEISIEKLFKHVKENAYLLLRAVTSWRKQFKRHLLEFSGVIFVRCRKYRQRSRKTTLENILLSTKKVKCYVITEKKLLDFALA